MGWFCLYSFWTSFSISLFDDVAVTFAFLLGLLHHPSLFCMCMSMRIRVVIKKIPSFPAAKESFEDHPQHTTIKNALV